MVRRIGIFPGTFDPIHVGHVAFAEEAQRQCHLDEVIFLPELQPRGKVQVSVLSQRIALISKILEEKTGLGILQLDDTQFTVDVTLPKLVELFRGSHLTLLLGSDVVRRFPRWPKVDELLKQMSLAIGMRTHDQQSEIDIVVRELEQKYHMQIQHDFISTPHAHVASSQIRANGDISFTPLL